MPTRHNKAPYSDDSNKGHHSGENFPIRKFYLSGKKLLKNLMLQNDLATEIAVRALYPHLAKLPN